MVKIDFGKAIEELKVGNKVAREGWNGKSMYVYMMEGKELPYEDITEETKKNLPIRDKVFFAPRIDMKAADDSIVIGWLASQTDMLAEDWVIVD